MQVHLMFKDKNFTIDNVLGSKKLNLTPVSDLQQINCLKNLLRDLELGKIIDAMSQGDKVIYNISTAALLQPLQTEKEIKYRQNVLQDALNNREIVRNIYNICLETEKQKNASWSWLTNHFISSTFHNAIELLQIYLAMLKKLRIIADRNFGKFTSEGFQGMFKALQEELSDEYLQEANALLCELRNTKSTLLSAKFGCFLQGTKMELRKYKSGGFHKNWWFAPSFTIAKRDERGAQDLSNRIDRATNESANALAQAAEHLDDFFTMLEKETAFYVGCLNLADTMKSIGMLLSGTLI